MRQKRGNKADSPANAGETVPALRALAYREAFLQAMMPDDVRTIAAVLLDRAKAGDVTAARLVLDRALGPQSIASWESREAVEERARLEELFKLA